MLDLRPAQGPRIVLQLSEPHDEGLEVRVIESPVGEHAAARIVLQRIEDVLRMVSQPTFHEDVGRGLFRSLFPTSLGELYRAAFTHATLAGQTLTVELRFDPDLVRFARYPWELLHDGTRFLLQSGAINLSRYLTFPEPVRPLETRSPLEVLIVSARPKDQPPLVSEFDALQAAFRSSVREDKLDLGYLLPPTWDALMDWLLAGAPGVLHFEGHGAFTRTGLLVFEDEDGTSDPVDATTLGSAFYGTDLRLAVLSACESAKAAGESLLGSVAPSLILAGIPAVVAMQQSLPDAVANRFSRGFYNALLAGQDIESAVAAGRKQLIRTTFWHVPTLYLRAHKTPQITRAFLERRVDTAGPRAVPINFPFRFGLWIRRPDSPKPSDDELRRLLGLEPAAPVTRESTRAGMQFPVEMGQIRPGTVEVRLVAQGCEVHTAAVRQMTVFPDFDTPPLWFALTPHRAGRLDVIFELSQAGALIASLAHTINITEGNHGDPVASVKSHGDVLPPEPAKPDLVDVITAPGYVPVPVETPERDKEAAPPAPVRKRDDRQETEAELSLVEADSDERAEEVSSPEAKKTELAPDDDSGQLDAALDWLDDTDEAENWPLDGFGESPSEEPPEVIPDTSSVPDWLVTPGEEEALDVQDETPRTDTKEEKKEKVPISKFDTTNAEYGATISAHVVTGAEQVRLIRLREEGSLEVAVRGTSTGDEANAQLIALLAGMLGIDAAHVTISDGHDLADKMIDIDGATLIKVVRVLSSKLAAKAEPQMTESLTALPDLPGKKPDTRRPARRWLLILALLMCILVALVIVIIALAV
jgi:uncharacterized protein YggU (UPF0235/DUF167 family)